MPLSVPQAHWVEQVVFLVTAVVVAVALVAAPANSWAFAVESVAGRHAPVAALVYLPPEQVSCLNPYMPGAQVLRQVSKPGTHAVAVAVGAYVVGNVASGGHNSA